jgi:hypothetical protein
MFHGHRIMLIGSKPRLPSIQSSAYFPIIIVQHYIFAIYPQVSCVREISIRAFLYPGKRVSEMAMPHNIAEVKSAGFGIGLA